MRARWRAFRLRRRRRLVVSSRGYKYAEADRVNGALIAGTGATDPSRVKEPNPKQEDAGPAAGR